MSEVETGEWEIWIDDVCGELAMTKGHLARRKISVVELEAFQVLQVQNKVMASALEWYGYKMVPDSLNEGKELITTALGARARACLAVAGSPAQTEL